MIPRPDLLDPRSPAGTEVFQLTHEDIPSSHIYMEAQIFTPDSRRFVLHRSATAHGSDKQDPEHQFLLCDLDHDGELTPLTQETGAVGAGVSPNGQDFYYFVDETVPGGGRLLLKHKPLRGGRTETLFVLDGPIPGTAYRPSRAYPLSTISSDGQRIAISAFLGDGNTAGAPWGLLVFDLAAGEVRLPLLGLDWFNMHPQYCRSSDPDASHDLLVQQNHGCSHNAQGVTQVSWAEPGPDIHVVRDDGTDFRTVPCGRDGLECCQGHQCWRGTSNQTVIGTSRRPTREFPLIACRPVPDQGHTGIATPGGWRNDLTRGFPTAHGYHFATDAAGKRLITDQGAPPGPLNVFLADFASDPDQPLRNVTFLLDSRTQREKTTHVHPFLSPDGQSGFFNSSESGCLQAYMIRNLPLRA